MNLLEELDENSSKSYVTRVVARSLGHAVQVMGLAWFEAREIWEDAGYSTEEWDRLFQVMQNA